MASQSNVYPCSSSVSWLICHALTSLYSWLHILIFTLTLNTFILHWKHLSNANVPSQHELCTHTSSLLCPTNFTYTPIPLSEYLSFQIGVQSSTSLLNAVAVRNKKQYFHPLMQTHLNLGKWSHIHSVMYKTPPLSPPGRLPDRLTCVPWQTECPADSPECSRMYNPSYAVLLLWMPIRLA